MGEIKAAWELAMERSEGLSVDKEEIKKKELFQKGRALGLKSLDNDLEWLKSEITVLNSYSSPEKASFLQGCVEALLSNYQLLLSTQVQPSQKIPEIFKTLTGKDAEKSFSQLTQVVTQFTEELERLREAILKQMGPRLQQRAEQVARQQGVPLQYAMERDPEYLKVFNQNLEMIRSQYSDYLEKIKVEVRSFVV